MLQCAAVCVCVCCSMLQLWCGLSLRLTMNSATPLARQNKACLIPRRLTAWCVWAAKSNTAVQTGQPSPVLEERKDVQMALQCIAEAIPRSRVAWKRTSASMAALFLALAAVRGAWTPPQRTVEAIRRGREVQKSITARTGVRFRVPEGVRGAPTAHQSIAAATRFNLAAQRGITVQTVECSPVLGRPSTVQTTRRCTARHHPPSARRAPSRCACKVSTFRFRPGHWDDARAFC